jgi:DNA-directed RNA polymerase specialized sigma24 family protein
LPATEIAAITGLSAANVHQIASRSLRRLRELARVSDSA